MYDLVLTLKKTVNVHINVTVRARSWNIFAAEKQYYYIFRVCVSSLSCSACKASAPYYTYIFICGLSGCTIFFHIISQSTWFSGKKLLTWNVFWFSLQLLSETFLILRETERDMIENVYRSSCKLPFILSDFNETWTFSTEFRKNTQISNFIKIRSVEAGLFHADGQTDMTKLVVAFRNFANVPETYRFCPHKVYLCFIWLSEHVATVSFINLLKPKTYVMYHQL